MHQADQHEAQRPEHAEVAVRLRVGDAEVQVARQERVGQESEKFPDCRRHRHLAEGKREPQQAMNRAEDGPRRFTRRTSKNYALATPPKACVGLSSQGYRMYALKPLVAAAQTSGAVAGARTDWRSDPVTQRWNYADGSGA
jgi:hypothetical protein